MTLDTHCSTDLQREMKEAVSQGCSAACPKHCTVIPLQKQALGSLKRKRTWLQREKHNPEMEFSHMYLLNENRALLGRNMAVLGLHYEEHRELYYSQYKQL